MLVGIRSLGTGRIVCMSGQEGMGFVRAHFTHTSRVKIITLHYLLSTYFVAEMEEIAQTSQEGFFQNWTALAAPRT